MPDKLENKRIPYFGDFVVFEEIGRGGMGVVYDAQQSSPDRPVALKILHSSFISNQAAVQRLRLEAEAAARLNHPNIVPIYEVGEHEGQPYLAMQLVEGESLAERIEKPGANLNERDAAALMAKIAQAVHHAHQRGVLHRDLKPGNILLDAGGEPHLIDFGLAKCLEKNASMTQTGVFLGTPAYASPEQAAGQNKSLTTASDIYSLGAILYALLTGRPPFAGESIAETINKVKHEIPAKLQPLRSTLSLDLETICLKCLEKEPARRYATALALADDLYNYLAARPIAARPVGKLERVWMWTRRNPLQAALWAILFLAVIASTTGISMWRNLQARESEARRQIRQHQLIEEVQAIRLTAPRADGWFDRAWSNACAAARIPTTVTSDDVRDQTAALLAGVDARQQIRFTNGGSFSVAFDRAGHRLLMSGCGQGASLWDNQRRALNNSGKTNAGPVAFCENGTALQLVHDAGRRLLSLNDVVSSRTVREWKVPADIGSESISNPVPEFESLSRDGTTVIAVFKSSASKSVLCVFFSDTMSVLEVTSNLLASVTISTDGSLVAAADLDGKIKAWVVADGRCIAEFTASRNRVSSLALTRVRRVVVGSATGTWLLAVGDAGGLVTVWDMGTRAVCSYCRGGHYQVEAVAFSPDGTTLASGGTGPVKLWDVATGHLLLDVHSSAPVVSLDFSPDGNRLAIGNGGLFRWAYVTIWQLEFGRGMQTLRGLSGQISKVCFSPDGRILAALSHDWELGCWQLPEGRLMQVIAAPKGEFADNAALAFTPDSQRLVFSAARTAKMWSVASGRELGAWNLRPGLVDTLGFTADGHLLLFCLETQDGEHPPFSEYPPQDYPRVCRIRDLLGTEPQKPIAEIHDFNWRVLKAQASLDGRYIAVQGVNNSNNQRQISINNYDSLTGKRLWTIASTKTQDSGYLACDAATQIIATRTNESTEALLVDFASGARLNHLAFQPIAFRLEPRLYVAGYLPWARIHGLALLNDKSLTPLIRLGIDSEYSNVVAFNAEGNQLAWGNLDGTVTLCNLREIQARLHQIGLAW